MFSYGSGLTSTMFSFKINEGHHPFSLLNIANIMDVSKKLKARHVVSIIDFFPKKNLQLLSLKSTVFNIKWFGLGCYNIVQLLHWSIPMNLKIGTNPLVCSMQVPPKKFIEVLKLMEHRYGAKDFVTSQDTSLLSVGTYYLTHVDSKYRRFYDVKGDGVTTTAMSNGH